MSRVQSHILLTSSTAAAACTLHGLANPSYRALTRITHTKHSHQALTSSTYTKYNELPDGRYRGVSQPLTPIPHIKNSHQAPTSSPQTKPSHQFLAPGINHNKHHTKCSFKILSQNPHTKSSHSVCLLIPSQLDSPFHNTHYNTTGI